MTVHDEHRPFARDKPEGVQGLQLFVGVGEVLPRDMSGWTYLGVRTRCRFEVALPAWTPADPGQRVWWIARWVNPCGQPGPWGKATSVFTQRVEGGLAGFGNGGRRAA